MKKRLYQKILTVVFILSFCNHVFSSDQCLREDPEDEESSYDLSPHLQHISDFSLDLFRKLLPLSGTKNLFLSPYSVWNALALAYLGSEGETEEQLRKVLKIRSKEETLKKWRAVDYVYQMRQMQSRGYRFGMVNKAYFHKDFQLRDCIHQVLKSELELIDFNKPELAASKINDFVIKMTEGKISSLTTAEAVENNDMALVNAAFFNDYWKYSFNESDTKLSSFYTFDGEEEQVNMMRKKGNFKHAISENLRSHILEIPYSLENISMYIFLPPSILGEEGLKYLIEKLTEKNIEQATEEVVYANLDIAVPKMSMSSVHDDDLKQALQSLGIIDLFDPNKANLTTFVPTGGISVTKTIHQTFLEVTEEGTTAATASAVYGTGRSARPTALQSFVCDHPFVFIIYDKLTKNVLFMGLFKNST